MSVLRFEMSSDGDNWSAIDELHSGEPYGSISDQHDDGSTYIYTFGVDPTKDAGVIKRSTDGVDTESGQSRVIHSDNWETVAHLYPGEHHEMMVKTRRSPAAMLIRFTYSQD